MAELSLKGSCTVKSTRKGPVTRSQKLKHAESISRVVCLAESDESVESGEVQSSRRVVLSNCNPRINSRRHFIDNFSEEMFGEQENVGVSNTSIKLTDGVSVPEKADMPESGFELSGKLIRFVVGEEVFIRELCVLSESEIEERYSKEEFAKLLASFEKVSFLTPFVDRLYIEKLELHYSKF
jgi:hypothetical protein